MARIYRPSPVIRRKDGVVGPRLERRLAGHKNHNRRRDARQPDPVGHQVPLAAEEIGQRGPEERGDDAHGGNARVVVVNLALCVAECRRDGLAAEIEQQQRVATKRLGLARNHPENDESPPVPRRKDLFHKHQCNRRPLFRKRHSVARKLALLFREIHRRRGVRRIWEEQEPVYRDGNGEQAVDDEEPAPASEPEVSVQVVVEAGLDEAANHGTSEAGGSEDAAALAELALRVPCAEDVVCADKGGRFADALEEADGHDGARVVHGGRHHGQAAPEDHHEREPDARLDVVQRQVGWDLAEHVADGEAGVDDAELVAYEAEVFFHAGDVGIGEVGSVELGVGQ